MKLALLSKTDPKEAYNPDHVLSMKDALRTFEELSTLQRVKNGEIGKKTFLRTTFKLFVDVAAAV